MEENKNEEQAINTEEIKEEQISKTEEIKKEASEVVNEVKETIKNANVQEKANESIELVKTMFKDPFGAVKKVAEDKAHKYIWLAVILASAWTLVELIYAFASISTIRYWSFQAVMNIVGGAVKALIAPSLSIFALSLIIWLFNKNSKKSLLATLSGITIIKTPVIAAAIIDFLRLIPGKIYPIANAFSGLCSALSIVFSYFLIKEIYEEKEDSKFMIKFIIIYAIYYAVALVSSYIGIGI